MVLVMEYAAGGELYDYLSERKVLSEEEARRIFRQIATAVYYCHKVGTLLIKLLYTMEIVKCKIVFFQQHNICHRDLKLENILLDEIGNAKVSNLESTVVHSSFRVN